MSVDQGSQVPQLFVLLFSMAGPIKMIPVFAAASAGVEANQARSLSIKVALLGLVGFLLAVFVGVGMMQSWGVSQAALGTGAGLVLLLSALMPMISPGQLGHGSSIGSGTPSAAALTFPTMLAPNAMGIIMLFAAYLPSQSMSIVALGAVLMTINALCMMFAKPLLKIMGLSTLHVLGAIFGILQLSLGAEMIFWGIRTAFA